MSDQPSNEKLAEFLEAEAAQCERLDCFIRDGNRIDVVEMAANLRAAAQLLRSQADAKQVSADITPEAVIEAAKAKWPDAYRVGVYEITGWCSRGDYRSVSLSVWTPTLTPTDTAIMADSRAELLAKIEHHEQQ